MKTTLFILGKNVMNYNKIFDKVFVKVLKYLLCEPKEVLKEFDSNSSNKNYQKQKVFFDKIKNMFIE